MLSTCVVFVSMLLTSATVGQMSGYGKKKDKKKDKVTLFEIEKKKDKIKAQDKKAAAEKKKEQAKIVSAQE